MTTALLSHSDCLRHETPMGHPEQVARLQTILAAFNAPIFADLQRVEAPLGTDADILLAHPASHITAINNAAPDVGIRSLDADTHMSPGSLRAAYLGVGASIKAVDMVMAGEAANAFCAIRPPGHHAEKTTAMGFCLFGNISIAAKHALENHALNRVAIVDFDVHHGNGTQNLVWDDNRILFTSTHQMPLYPGSGAMSETGAHDNILNVPLTSGCGSAAYREKFSQLIMPALNDFEPELLLVSAGFDAHQADPLANINLSTDDFFWVTQAICDVADRHASGRVVSTLEGGYDLGALAAATAAHVKVLMERGK